MSELDLPYIPIVLQFVPAITSTSTTVASVYNSFKLLITQEASSNYNTYQALPQQYVVTVPASGVVRLKLLLLDKAKSQQSQINRYRVFYYSGAEVIDEQYWKVPNINLPTRTATITNLGEGTPVSIPPKLYEITEISPKAEYSIVDNMLYFDNSAPLGDYVITYQPGLSLYDLVM